MKSWFAVGVSVFALCGNAFAHDAKNSDLTFSASPYVGTNENAEFTSCGFVIEAEKPPTRQSDGARVAIRLAATANNYYQVVSATGKRVFNNPNYSPTPYIIQWIKVGDAPPVKLAPFNLITQKERGLSSFMTESDENLAILQEVQKTNPPVWVSFFLQGQDDHVVYSGTLRVSDSARAQFRQCLKSMR
jgi:hypothetical protein